MERTDDTGFSGIRVIQTERAGYGVDAVLLSAFAAGETGAGAIEEGSRIADFGTGCGVVAFILRHKLGGARITGFDVQVDAVERAARACKMNGFEEDIDFVCCDIKEIDGKHPAYVGCFDAVVSNPPYFRRTPDEPGAKDPDERYIARHEMTADFGDFAGAAASLLKDGGSFYLVHRPDRLADIICEMRAAGIEPKEMQLVVPSAGKSANIVLIRGVKGASPELRMLPGIAVHEAGGGYTPEILKMYER
jgi:tRNA1Val (adenine37-N6)-methyltransferase